MEKISAALSNDYCPQTLFLYGTYKEDNTPNFGLFCWASYCYFDELGFIACIGGEKLTRDRIKENKVFSANLVTKNLLPLADYFGNKEGYDKDKMSIPFSWEKGGVLNVPVLTDSPVSFELEVAKSIVLEDSEVFLCKIRNVLHDSSIKLSGASLEEIVASIKPVSSTCESYFDWDGKLIADWGQPSRQLK